MIVHPCISGLKMGCADWPGLAGLSWDGSCPSCADPGTESEGRWLCSRSGSGAGAAKTADAPDTASSSACEQERNDPHQR